MAIFLFDGNMAEEALIMAESGYPELYNISSSDYHNLFLKKKKKKKKKRKEPGDKYFRYCITSQKRISRPLRSVLHFFKNHSWAMSVAFLDKDTFCVNGPLIAHSPIRLSTVNQQLIKHTHSRQKLQENEALSALSTTNHIDYHRK